MSPQRDDEPERRKRERRGHPSTGDLYAFHTLPLFDFSPVETARHAAFKILGVDGQYIVIAVLDGVWADPPSVDEAREAAILREHRFAYSGKLAVFGLALDWWSPSDLKELIFVGQDDISTEEKSIAEGIFNRRIGSRYSTMSSPNWSAEGEWRWKRDREAFISDCDRKDAQDRVARAAREERYRTRLSKLTWERLLAETPFERWSPSPPFPPLDFTRAAREAIHRTCKTLSLLGPKPRKAEVRSVLRECVEWFNDADTLAGGVIETEEREDICAVLEEMAYVARQRGLVDEIDGWRRW